MSEYYNPARKASWNYGGKQWKLSRSKIDLFLECPRCFYLDNKLGLKRVPGFPFNLNSAVDSLLKQEFDSYRVRGEQHPIQIEFGLDARPAPHDELDEWRRNFGGVTHRHSPTGLLVSGAIDDLWIDGHDEYLVVDYKATAKPQPVVALDQDYHIGYKRQMEVYQWLLRQNGLTVSDTGYFVYCTGIPDKPAFDRRLEFHVHLIPYTGNDAWVEDTLFAIHTCLEGDAIPDANPECAFCAYWEARDAFERE